MAILLWLVLPYAAIGCFTVGHVWRWHYDQFGWKTFRTPLVRNRWLRLGSPLVHVGVTAVFAGHLIGLLVPRSWTAAVGVTDAAYRLISATAGTLAGCIMLVGLVLLVARRAVLRQQTTTIMDVAMYAVLTVVVLLGIWATVGVNLLGAGHDYRQTVAVWFRGLLLLRPQPSLMAGAPLLLQIHTAAAFALVAIWPFTRLVHALAVPIGLVWQPSATSPAYRDTNPASRPVERSRRSSPSGGIETPASTQ